MRSRVSGGRRVDDTLTGYAVSRTVRASDYAVSPAEERPMSTDTHTGTTGTGLASLPFRAIGDQPAFEAADIEPFVAATRIAVLAYVRLDGRPGQVPIWYVHRDG